MNKKIRQGVFETNSSSTHSICIAKDAEITLPQSLHFSFGEFGWECDTLQDLSSKASYLYTGLFANDMTEQIENIVSTLTSKGIAVTTESAKSQKRSYTDSDGKLVEYDYAENAGYVDHSNELTDFLADVCSDDGKLLRYLFSDLSFIITGNDNDDSDVEISVSYPHDEYYKGN